MSYNIITIITYSIRTPKNNIYNYVLFKALKNNDYAKTLRLKVMIAL